jgi:hypothetical protein
MARMKRDSPDGKGGEGGGEMDGLLAQKDAQIASMEQRMKKLGFEYKVKVEEAEAARKSAYDVLYGGGGL